MSQIILLTDYENCFGTKYISIPYRSGMDKELLKQYFSENDIEVTYVKISEVFEKVASFCDKVFLYTSSEDVGRHYKAFIEDVVLAISSMGGTVIPGYKFLHAHDNKVFMELLRREWSKDINDKLKSYAFGSLEDYLTSGIEFTFPVVVKRPVGSMSRGVFLAHNKKELETTIKKISRTQNIKEEFKELVRPFIHKGYKRKSLYRRKFIVQNFIPGLDGDYKVLVFGKNYYVVQRKNRKNDFRASGSGLCSWPEKLPLRLLDYSNAMFSYLKVPFISLDIAFDGTDFYMLELQFVYFGMSGIQNAPHYFTKKKEGWELVKEKMYVEKEYADSMSNYLKNENIIG